jgi:hypothetical protein
MSQAGIVDFESSHPQVPTTFVTNSGTAIPIANTLEILATTVAAHSIPIETTGSGDTVTVAAQYASAAVSSVAANAGFASFNSTDFSVDDNGYVNLTGGAAFESFMVDASTAPGTNPVVPSVAGIVTVTGGQVPAGTTTNVIRTDSLAANTYTIQIQRSQAVASSTEGDNGVSHFNSTYFTVDPNGFVSLNSSGIGETITGNTGGALSPTTGNWNIIGTSTAAGTTPVQTSGTGSTLTVQIQKSQAIESTNATNVGLAAFNSTYFTVDSNGFVSLNSSGAGETITGNSGGALSPTAGNWNIVGAGSITTSGSVSTLTVQLTGLTNHAVLVGAGTTTVTNIGPSATTGNVLLSQGSSADPAFSTTTYPSTSATGNLIYGSAANVYSNLGIGSSGNILQVSGGLPVWTAPIFFSNVTTQSFFSSGTYTPTTGMKFCSIEAVGGGGGGGGVKGGTGLAGAAGGGGGGAYARGWFSAATIGASQTITVSSGGNGGTNTGGDGGAGGSTTIGSLMTASGGGLAAGITTPLVTGISLGGAGAGGGFVAGQFLASGGAGGNGFWTAALVCGGAGGGGGGVGSGNTLGRATTSSSATQGSGGNAWGGGGGGGIQNNSATGAAGGNGQVGFVYITEFS